MPLPPPKAPPVSRSGRAADQPAAIHIKTNARIAGEVEWKERNPATMLELDLPASFARN